MTEVAQQGRELSGLREDALRGILNELAGFLVIPVHLLPPLLLEEQFGGSGIDELVFALFS